MATSTPADAASGRNAFMKKLDVSSKLEVTRSKGMTRNVVN
jgi:hypothetical protein